MGPPTATGIPAVPKTNGTPSAPVPVAAVPTPAASNAPAVPQPADVTVPSLPPADNILVEPKPTVTVPPQPLALSSTAVAATSAADIKVSQEIQAEKSADSSVGWST